MVKSECPRFLSFTVLLMMIHRFRGECKAGGKQLMVWTVNQPQHMMEAVRWEVDAILTDVTKTWLDLRSALQSEFHLVRPRYLF